MWLKIKVPHTSEITNFCKYIKDKYNLKIHGIFHALLTHPELLDEIDKLIDKADNNYRFKKYM